MLVPQAVLGGAKPGLQLAREKFPSFFAKYDKVDFDQQPPNLVMSFVKHYYPNLLPDIGSDFVKSDFYISTAVNVEVEWSK